MVMTFLSLAGFVFLAVGYGLMTDAQQGAWVDIVNQWQALCLATALFVATGYQNTPRKIAVFLIWAWSAWIAFDGLLPAYPSWGTAVEAVLIGAVFANSVHKVIRCRRTAIGRLPE